MAAAGELDGSPEHVLPALEVTLRRLKLVLGRMLGDADAVLLRLQQLEWDRVRVEGLQELASLVGELGEHPREHHPALGCLGLPLDDLGLQLLGEPAHPRVRKLDPPIQVLHDRLDVAGKDVGLAAPGPCGIIQAERIERLRLGIEP